jgi:hypothetical protein
MTFTRSRREPKRRLRDRGPDIETLHHDYECRGRIDHCAPIRASHSVVIDAPVSRVWGLLSRPEGWHDIDPAITDVRLESGVVAGGRFTWRSRKARLVSQFAVVDPERELTWTGTGFGAKVVHRHVLEALHDGRTQLFSEESMAGLLVALIFDDTKLHRALERWLTAISLAATSGDESRP